MAKRKESSRRGDSGNFIGTLNSFFIPGLGQLIIWAAFFFLATASLYFSGFLLIPSPFALIFHLWPIINAATFNPG